MSDTPILREGETCWRKARARRLAVLVDGESYFATLAEALESAERSIWMLGWDFHSAVRLRPDAGEGRPGTLVPLLESLVRDKPELHVRILAWDYAMLYALEREFMPLLVFGARTHRRIVFAMDSAHPATASQHQKVVVIDDALAFSGGLDLTTHRWDTREHRPDDPGRVTPGGKPYAPFHDVQMAVSGEAAAALGDLARERWRRAVGGRLEERVAAPDAQRWPASLEPLLEDVEVGIARTLPSYRGQVEVREVEALYVASIAAARRFIYIENQYFTSSRVTDALVERLGQPDPPEVVVVGPRGNAGWLEENTMGALRDYRVRQLRDADPGGRVGVFYPHLDTLPDDQMINVHAKVMVVDERFARVGSSNLSNRSLGLDSECDLAFEADGRDETRAAIARLRDDLLAEHLGTDVEHVSKEIEHTGSLLQTIEALGGEPRTLRPLELDADDWAGEAIDTLGAVDPEYPAPLDELASHLSGETRPSDEPSGNSPILFVVGLVALAGLALVWRWTPLSEWITPEQLAATVSFLRDSWYGPLLAGAIFVGASLVLIPVTALIAAAGLALGPVTGLIVAWTGSVIAAAIGHSLGRLLWRDTVRRIAGERLDALNERLSRRGLVSSALVRLVPVAPFAVVNLVAGATRVRLRDFALGTALGMLPGSLVLVFAADSLAELFREPSGRSWLWAGVAALALVGAVAASRKLASPPRSVGSG